MIYLCSWRSSPGITFYTYPGFFTQICANLYFAKIAWNSTIYLQFLPAFGKYMLSKVLLMKMLDKSNLRGFLPGKPALLLVTKYGKLVLSYGYSASFCMCFSVVLPVFIKCWWECQVSRYWDVRRFTSCLKHRRSLTYWKRKRNWFDFFGVESSIHSAIFLDYLVDGYK